ncbi:MULTISPECIES: hypothetical protein [Sphingomonas]|jgi:hypothetical protein|uniref:Uncharacterized protein n=1 Tax=Sphingomonas echinoides TaxID=59803 RepID=A0ABU4PQ84_9SPHN|nr:MULTISPECIES: hypothetical protein [Sphingomonas]MDR6850431.1 putative MPP superfamily phosphohydrolase [Sphingomonas sp. BE137]MDX5986308.1 hypothetical protein [Sphingomonas echinoides]
MLLDHQPKNPRDAAARGVAKRPSGHTNGGMIRGPDQLAALANAGFIPAVIT